MTPTPRRTSLLAAAALSASVLFGDLPPPASAAPAKAGAVAARMQGEYAFAGGDKEQKARDAAIEEVVQEMNALVRPIARSRLKKANAIPERVAISADGKHLTVRLDGRVYTAPLDGGAVKVKGITGDELTLRYRVSSGRIAQLFRGDDGGRDNRFSLDGERLRIQVRVFSEKLPKDLSYELSYRPKR